MPTNDWGTGNKGQGTREQAVFFQRSDYITFLRKQLNDKKLSKLSNFRSSLRFTLFFVCFLGHDVKSRTSINLH